MSPMSSRPTELALPAAALASLRGALTAEFGEDAAARVLRNAGHDAGDAFFQILSSDAGAAPAGSTGSAIGQLSPDAFWRRFSQLFYSRGWGSLAHFDVHPGIAVLAAADWAEADASGVEARPGCYFTTGILANVLGKVAGGDVAVMEVECRSRGDAQCRFMFGSPDALRGVYDLLVNGASTENAVAQLA